jgi:hypothetical protein
MLKAMLFCVLVVSLPMAKGISYDVPQEVRDVVKETLSGQGMLMGFDEGNFKQALGFDSLTQLKDVKYGEPIPEYIIMSNDTIKEHSPVSQIAVFDSLWYIPLLENNVCVSILKVRCVDGIWKDVGAGGKGAFVTDLQHVRAAWANKKIVFVFLPILNTMCFHIPDSGDYNLTPIDKDILFDTLNSNKNMSYSTLLDENVILRAHNWELAKLSKNPEVKRHNHHARNNNNVK